MKGIRYFFCVIMLLTGILAVNAIPYVPHHHHDGKICVENTENDSESHDADGSENFHSEDGEYDMPREDVRMGEDCITAIILISYSELNDEVTLVTDYEPERGDVFSQKDYAVQCQELRGSPEVA